MNTKNIMILGRLTIETYYLLNGIIDYNNLFIDEVKRSKEWYLENQKKKEGNYTVSIKLPRISNNSKRKEKGSLLEGTLLGLLSSNNKTKKKDTSGLMPWERKKVKKGNYNSWNLEEEELEDDDYYNEDID